MSAGAEVALACTSLRVQYRGSQKPALDGIDLQVGVGEPVALLGLNGSGKTTLLAAIAGLTPFTGTVSVNGVALVKGRERAVRDKLGFLFSTPDDQLLLPRVVDDVAFTLERRGVVRREALARATEILERLGVGAFTQAAPHQLSHGQRQRVALAGALVAAPPLLLLDEPTSALDPVGRAELARLLADLPCAMLLATHDIEFARRVARRFLVLEDGEIVYDGAEPPPRFLTGWLDL